VASQSWQDFQIWQEFGRPSLSAVSPSLHWSAESRRSVDKEETGRMLCAWQHINNPNRSPRDDLNLQIGGALVLTAEEVAKLAAANEGLLQVMDDDPFSDDTVFVPFAFQLGADGNRQAKKRGHWQALSPCRASRRKLTGYTAQN
jgi:hypothetical protein